MVDTKVLIRGLFIFGAVVVLSGCGAVARSITKGTHKPYRADEPLDRYTGKKAPLELGYIEFDDQGDMWRSKALTNSPLFAVHKRLKSVVTALTTVVIYIHGWNNNASRNNGNLLNFQASLAAIERELPTHKVFGVYIGWRGTVSAGDGILVDFYDRQSSVSRIAGPQLVFALNLLSLETHKQHPKNRVIAVGHSFGAAILLEAIANPLAQELAENKVNGKTIRPLADSLILVNPAKSALLARNLVKLMDESMTLYSHPSDRRPLPLITSITSEGDWATGPLFGSVAWFTRQTLSPLMSAYGGQSVDRSQERAITNAIGFYKDIHSHELACDSHASKHDQERLRSKTGFGRLVSANLWPRVESNGSITARLCPTDSAGNGELQTFKLQRKPGTHNTTPFWVLQVPQFVVADHNDIWNANFAGLLTALHRASSPQVTIEGMKAAESEVPRPALRVQQVP